MCDIYITPSAPPDRERGPPNRSKSGRGSSLRRIKLGCNAHQTPSLIGFVNFEKSKNKKLISSKLQNITKLSLINQKIIPLKRFSLLALCAPYGGIFVTKI